MAGLDTTKPNVARIYDYWLGGKDNFKVDRDAAEAVLRYRPDVADMALENKQFLTRAVSYAAGQGIRQFVDVGSGLPTSSVRTEGAAPLWLSTHEAAQSVVPAAAVAYVDNDPVAVVHSRALLAERSKTVVAVEGDMRNPAAILADEAIRETGITLDEPACVILGCVLHFLDYGTAREVMAGFTKPLAPGSQVIVSVGYGSGEVGQQFASTYNAQQGSRMYNFSRDEIDALFDGLDLAAPGVVPAPDWRPSQPEAPRAQRSAMILAGVGQRP